MKKIITVVLMLCIFPNFGVFADTNISRIEFIQYILNKLDLNSFTTPSDFCDLSEDTSEYKIAAIAKEYGIINGYDDGNLRPFENLTREDAVVILSRAYKPAQSEKALVTGFADYDKISDYAKTSVSLAIQNGILKYNSGDKFEPKKPISRDEALLWAEAFSLSANKELGFSLGYPKESPEKKHGAISIRIKTTKPCSIFYTLVPNSGNLSGFKPQPEKLDKFLSSISIAETPMNFNIYPEDFGVYNLYIAAMDSEGNYSTTETIFNVSAHLYEYGDGTESNPYQIYNKEQLRGIERYPDKCFILQNDIENVGEWEPITSQKDGNLGFSGVLDGNFHKITGVKISGRKKDVGLFSTIYGAKIKNLYVDAEVEGSSDVGIIAGCSEGGRIEGSVTCGRVNSYGNNGGGIVGLNNGEIKNSLATAYMVEASTYAGGIAGINRGNIENCLSAVYSVSSNMYASGAAGANIGGLIKNTVCANSYARDVLVTRSGRITTNKQSGQTSGNYCYDKIVSHATVNFGEETSDGKEVSWEELTSPDFYKTVMNWDTEKIWQDNVTDDFRLISLRGFDGIDMIKGITSYAPIKISNDKDLKQLSENPDSHYILTNDIVLDEDYEWKTVADNDEGFNGTFDGNNHKISGIYVPKNNKQYGMFGTISAGTVRNLRLENIIVESDSLAGTIAANNYGYIYNCNVSGKIYSIASGKSISCGGIVGNNFGEIENVVSNVKIKVNANVANVGGIAANNEGFINYASYNGKIQSISTEKNSNAIVGGLVGINTSGNIYNSRSVPQATLRAYFNYVGSAVGIIHDGEIYKTFTGGNITVNSADVQNAVSYIGGSVGLADAGLVVNNFSESEIYADSSNIYAGGIAGFNRETSIQNNYSAAKISAVSKGFPDTDIFSGGICAAAEGGFILDNVFAGKSVKSDSYVSGIASITNEYAMCTNNYISRHSEILGQKYSDETEEKISDETNTEQFYFLPVAEGGKLGWDEGEIWYWNNGAPYLKDIM